jgi:hypothetical protein
MTMMDGVINDEIGYQKKKKIARAGKVGHVPC